MLRMQTLEPVLPITSQLPQSETHLFRNRNGNFMGKLEIKNSDLFTWGNFYFYARKRCNENIESIQKFTFFVTKFTFFMKRNKKCHEIRRIFSKSILIASKHLAKWMYSFQRDSFFFLAAAHSQAVLSLSLPLLISYLFRAYIQIIHITAELIVYL